MGYHVEIIFGKEQIIKHQQGITLTDYEKLINRKQYEFETLSERNAFYKGLSEADSRLQFEIINEHKTKSNKEENEPLLRKVSRL